MTENALNAVAVSVNKILSPVAITAVPVVVEGPSQ